jgi:L-2-hydroxycarboxylate dehydrogenase (NAD+)
VPGPEAELAAVVLTSADLRGIDSHGIARLRAYTDMFTMGRINPRANVRVLRGTASTATVDGDNGLGLVVGPRANEICMEKADAAGSGWVSVCNSNHYGIAGWYVLQGLPRNLINWSMTNASRMVTPLWGSERRLGTNPIAIAFPGLEEPPIVIDFATCAAAYGKLEIARRKGESIPRGWAIDKNGQDTEDPQAMMDGGAILPLGSDRPRGGHKGYALGLMVDVLSAVLSGANWGPFVPPFVLQQYTPERSVGKGLGHFFGAMRIDGFIDPDEFKRQIDDYIRILRATKPAPGTDGPLVPGDPERDAEAVRRREGVPVPLPVIEDLRAVSRVTGVPFPES